MEHPFNDLEGLRIAAEMEKRGAEFYTYAARLANNEQTRALCTRLAADERGHQAEFARLYQARETQGQDDWYDPESSAYLSAIAADIVFPGGLVEFGREHGFDSPTAILKSAIAAEKDSILFYYEARDNCAMDAARQVFQTILAQEKKHLSELQALLWEESR